MRMRTGTLAATVAATLLATAALAQEIKDERANPFVAPPSAAEEQARQDERMRNIVWQLQPELKSLIMQDVTASQAALEIKMRRRIDTAIEQATEQWAASGAGAGVLGSDAAAAAPAEAKVPEGATFISCVNGKALYRDKDNTLFQVAGDGVSGSDRCAK